MDVLERLMEKGSDPKVPEKEPRDGEEKHVNIISEASVDIVSLAKRRMVKGIKICTTYFGVGI